MTNPPSDPPQLRTGDPVEPSARIASRLEHAERVARAGSWEIDLATGRAEVSRGFRSLLLVDRDREFTLETLLALVAGRDRARIAAMIEAGAASGDLLETEFEAVSVDGSTRHFIFRAQVDRDAGILRGAVLDATALRTAERGRSEFEELFTQGFDTSPIGMALSDAATNRYLRVNDALCRLLDRPREQLLECGFDSVTDPEDVERELAARKAVLAGELDVFAFEKRFRRPNGAIAWASLTTSPVRGADGTIRAFYSHVVDIMQRKRRERQMERDAADAEWLGRIRDALERDRFVLYSQPIVDIADGATIQQELLIRLLNPDGAVIAPGAFLPAAERYGLMPAIDRWVVRQAARVAATGHAVEVNLSAASLGDPATLVAIESAIEETGAAPSLLVFEITETALATRIDEARHFAERLTAMGCRFALDDFGTGYGTFTYLKHLPVDLIKIDIEFVRDLVHNAADERVVRSIVTLAHQFGLTTVAEGIEDQPTLDRLRELGVDHAQGYFLGRPRPLPAHLLL